MDRITAIKQRLTTALAPESLEIHDDSHLHIGHAGAQSGAGHYRIDIVSSAFNGKSLIERHRMIYAALDDLMPTEIHALQISAKAS